MTLRAWDFGGQDVYHATHQFFYGGKAVFLLVWNPRGDFADSRLPQWLDRIKVLAPNSPVLLVATHAERHSANIPLAQIQRDYPIVRGLWSIDSQTGRGIGDLKAAVAAEAAKLEHMGAQRPASWVRAERAIEEDGRSFCTLQDFLNLVQKHLVQQTGEFLDALNTTGAITYFRENPLHPTGLPELAQFVILKPDWLLQQISLVLTDKEVAKQEGVFQEGDRKRIWSGLQEPVQEFLLRMMDHFDLAYRTSEGGEVRSIVVEMCPADRPEDVAAEWGKAAGGTEIGVLYQFKTTMPPGFPTWFTARNHGCTQRRLHWRYGALLSDGRGHTALLEADLQGRAARLAARGEFPQTLFGFLRYSFESTLDFFPGLQYDLRIPCPGGEEKCDRNFALDDIRKFQSNRWTTMQCQGCGRMQPIATLLSGIDVPAEAGVSERQLAALTETMRREFLRLFHREQSREASQCPRVFSLEVERLPKLLPDALEGMWQTLKGETLPVDLTIYCEHPGEWHPVKTYRLQAPAERLLGLRPLVKKLSGIMGVVRSAASEPMELLANALPEEDLVRPAVDAVGETREARRAELTALSYLHDLLRQAPAAEHGRWGGLTRILTRQHDHLWLCESHAKPYAREWNPEA